jgi:inhibitor of cysteine peptidase
MRKLILPALLFLVLQLSFAQEKTYKETDPSIDASVGENFNIMLPSNHTTGYSWSLGMIADNSQVVIIGTDYDIPETPKMGEGGDEIWHLKAVASGNVTLKFYYARSWEKEKPAREVSFSVNIK